MAFDRIPIAADTRNRMTRLAQKASRCRRAGGSTTMCTHCPVEIWLNKKLKRELRRETRRRCKRLEPHTRGGCHAEPGQGRAFYPTYEGAPLGAPLCLLALAATLRAANFEPVMIDAAIDPDHRTCLARTGGDCAWASPR